MSGDRAKTITDDAVSTAEETQLNIVNIKCFSQAYTISQRR